MTETSPEKAVPSGVKTAEPSFDLRGTWLDGTRELVITGRETIRGEFVQDYECDPRDGTPIQTTRLCFEGRLTGNQLEGTVVTCAFRESGNVPGKGLVYAPLKMTVTSDGNKLEGDPSTATGWLNGKEIWEPITFTRSMTKCADNIEGDLQRAEAQGAKELLSLCQKLLAEGTSKSCLYPYGVVVDCFGPGVHLVGPQPATGPGLVGYPLVLLGLTGPGNVPNVKVVSTELYRDPMLITKDTCGPLLFLLTKAEEFMNDTGFFRSDLGAQREVIECVKKVCASLGWNTIWPR